MYRDGGGGGSAVASDEYMMNDRSYGYNSNSSGGRCDVVNYRMAARSEEDRHDDYYEKGRDRAAGSRGDYDRDRRRYVVDLHLI